MEPSFSVIIPTFNEEARIAGTLERVRRGLPQAEILVVDGGSSDRTVELAVGERTAVVRAKAGRGGQCRAGAAAAGGSVLFFLHADSVLPGDAARVLAAFFARPEVQIGTFRLGFDDPHPILRVSSWFTRFDTVFTRFGDQGIVVRREFYHQIGGFPPWPLFEDVELLRRARRLTRIHSFPAVLVTSARRFRERGPLRQQASNGRLLLRFLAGASPEELAREYRPRSPSSPAPPSDRHS
jgi:rSAM/selenodomain-associated transferase 2